MKKAYFARSISVFGTKQDSIDQLNIMTMGFEIIDIESPKVQEGYDHVGMMYFKPLVEECDVFFFRAQLNNRIGAGVYREIEWAQAKGKPIFELPQPIIPRVATPEETREYLRIAGRFDD